MKIKNTKVNDPSYFKRVVHIIEEGADKPLCNATGGGELTNVFVEAVTCNKCLKVMERAKK